ncbi:hypothetical protein D3C78_806840 [compost metagenome]
MGGQQPGDLIDPGEVIPGHGLRPGGEQADHAHAGNRQQGFGEAGHRQQKGAVLIGNCQQRDDHGGVATEHECPGTGVAQQRATSGAQRQPQGQGGDERQRCLGKYRHDCHRYDRPHGGADDLTKATGQHHAAQWLADDDHGHDRPLGLVQIEQKRQVQGQQPGRDGSQGKQQHPGPGVEHGLEVLQQPLHGNTRRNTSSKRSHCHGASTGFAVGAACRSIDCRLKGCSTV